MSSTILSETFCQPLPSSHSCLSHLRCYGSTVQISRLQRATSSTLICAGICQHLEIVVINQLVHAGSYAEKQRKKRTRSVKTLAAAAPAESWDTERERERLHEAEHEINGWEAAIRGD